MVKTKTGYVKLSNGKLILPSKLCTSCRDGEFIFQGIEDVMKLGCFMIKTTYICDNCGADSIRWRTR